jgi:hypothetical protein
MSLYGTEWRERGFRLWIRDVLIRIRILIPVHWCTDLDPDTALVFSGFQDANNTFISVCKDNKSVKKVIKQ